MSRENQLKYYMLLQAYRETGNIKFLNKAKAMLKRKGE